MPPRRRRSVRQPCVVCNSYLHPATQQEPDVSCDGCSQPPPLGIGHNKAPVAHIDCLLGPDDDARKGILIDQDDHGVTTWLCQTCRRRTMEPESAVAAAPTPCCAAGRRATSRTAAAVAARRAQAVAARAAEGRRHARSDRRGTEGCCRAGRRRAAAARRARAVAAARQRASRRRRVVPRRLHVSDHAGAHGRPIRVCGRALVRARRDRRLAAAARYVAANKRASRAQAAGAEHHAVERHLRVSEPIRRACPGYGARVAAGRLSAAVAVAVARTAKARVKETEESVAVAAKVARVATAAIALPLPRATRAGAEW